MKLSLRSLVGGLAALGWLMLAGCSSEGSNGSGGPACSDMSLGVCKIADAGVRHIALSTPGANGLTVDPESGLVYVVINGETGVWCGGSQRYPESLSIVDPAQSKESASVPTGPGPVWPLVDQKRKRVYVAASGAAGTVVVHNPTSGAMDRSFTLGGRPHDMGLDVSGDLMLVSNTFDKSQTYISLLNVNSGAVAANFQVPELPHKIVVDEAGRTAYAVSLGKGEITVVNLATGTKGATFSSGSIPQTSAMVFSPRRRLLYVGKTGGSTPSSGSTIVGVDVDSMSVKADVGTFTPAASTPTRPWGGFGLDDEGGLLYAAVANSNLVAVVDLQTNKPLAVFEVDACPWAVALDIPRGVGYVSSNGAAALTVFQLAKVKAALGR